MERKEKKTSKTDDPIDANDFGKLIEKWFPIKNLLFLFVCGMESVHIRFVNKSNETLARFSHSFLFTLFSIQI